MWSGGKAGDDIKGLPIAIDYYVKISAYEGSLKIAYDSIVIAGDSVTYAEAISDYNLSLANSTVVIYDGASENSVDLNSITAIIDPTTGLITSNIDQLQTNFPGVNPANFDGTEYIKVTLTDDDSDPAIDYTLSDKVAFPDAVTAAIAKYALENDPTNSITQPANGTNLVTIAQEIVNTAVGGTGSNYVTVAPTVTTTNPSVVDTDGNVVGSTGNTADVTFTLTKGSATKTVTISVTVQ